ncbi:RNA polymerase II degradation factor 1-like [Senna tora]|uniref:RNA polymerase II degradation factor 1-like n=1 Tax=Senna tora TaxID=362788 RepID=A0A834W447_9FABA|nr:RNA polymerase II degradation factor 1-like [Senna tora]
MEVPATAPPLSSAVAPPPHVNYPDSLDSSPRSRNTDSWDEPYPPSSAAAAVASNKLRLMCSYGGHIVPRPHDKSLCYVGGDTRIVVVERHTSLSDLSSRLSKTFLNDRPFTLKYLLPSEDLDSLISVTTDEDLDNMIEEYDRISNSSVKPSRIRLFLFPLKPDSSQSIPVINSSGKSEDWFLGMLNRGLSDSGSVNLLMGFDDEVVAGNLDAGSKDVDAATSGSFGNGKGVKQQGQDVHSVPDSPMLETSSSFGSTSSSPSLANLPPIRVHVDDGSGGGARVQDQKAVGIEDQFGQMGVSGAQKQDEGFALSSPPTVPAVSAVPGVPISSTVVSGEYQNRVVSDDERSDHGVPVGYRKPPTQQLQPQILPTQLQQKTTGGLDLASPDSVSSDNSFTTAMSRPKPVVYQDQVQVQVQIPSATTRVPSNPVDPKFTMSDSHGAVPIQTYYPVYPSQQQLHPQPHHQLEQQQYQYYILPARQTQPYNLSSQQPNISEPATTIQSSHAPTTSNPALVQQSAAYNPMRSAAVPKSEMTAGGYRTAVAGTPQLVQVPAGQPQQQFVAYSQYHHPSQSVAPTSAAPASYAYEYADPAHAQIYYSQPLPPTMPSQYQTMAGGAAAAEPSAQPPSDSMKQQIRTSQPL